MIAVVGAAGKTGRAVVAALRARGERPRGLVRRDPAVDEVTVDLLDADSVRAALDGADAVYHLAPNVHPDEQRVGRTVLDAARAV
ncbi:MAG TPA: NAD(P)H-binding protein, partial [Actinomycetes bacterium]|nr:NAD(P)H-binding protein [Actinomycetes bacterium]